MSPTVDGSKNNRLNRLLVSRHSISPVYPAPDELLAALQASVHTCTHTRSINAHAPAGCPLKGKQSGRPPAQLGLSAWRVFGRCPRRICSLHYLHSAHFHQCRLRFHCATVSELIWTFWVFKIVSGVTTPYLPKALNLYSGAALRLRHQFPPWLTIIDPDLVFHPS